MLRKPGFVIIAAGLLLIAAILYMLLYGSAATGSYRPLQAVPVDALMIFRTGDARETVKELREKGKMWETLKAFDALSKADATIRRLDSMIRQNEPVFNLYKKSELTLSLHKTGRDKHEFIYYLPVENVSAEKNLRNFIGSCTEGLYRSSVRKYENARITDLTSQGQGEFSYSFVNGLLLVSPSSILVEDAVRQLGLKSSPEDNRSFTRVARTAGMNVTGNLYLKYEMAGKLLDGLVADRYDYSFIRHFGGWTELDLTVREDAYLLNGFTSSLPGKNSFAGVLMEHSPRKTGMERIIPDNAAAFMILGIEDLDKYRDSYAGYLKEHGDPDFFTGKLDELNRQYGTDLAGTISGFFHDEAGVVFMDTRNADHDENTYFIMGTDGRSRAGEAMLALLDKIRKKAGSPAGTMEHSVRIDGDVVYTVYEMPVPFLARKIFGNVFRGVKNNYFTFVDNYLVFGNSIAALERLIRSNLRNTTLSSDIEFNRLSDYFSSRSNFCFYINFARSMDFLGDYLEPETMELLQDRQDILRQFQGAAFQLTSEGDLLYNNIFLKHTPDLREEPRTLWESRLDTAVDFKPALVLNHYTKENEIFVQDLSNRIYLISNSGLILWKLKLEGKIMGDVYQVDFYGNGKLQLLFNTRDKIHLIDRNGNYVDRYPVTLRSTATNGMALFDYDRDGDYRMPVATEDKRVYMYNLEGNIVSGWDFGKSEHEVTRPLQHFRIGSRDYIVFADASRPYFLNRRGHTRIDPEKQFEPSGNNMFCLTTGPEGKICFTRTDRQGRVYLVDRQGRVEEADFGRFSPDHFFLASDLDGNGRDEFMFADGDRLAVYNHDRSPAFEHTFGHPPADPPAVYVFSGDDKKIGMADREAGEIYLFNNDGSMYNGFPLRGSGMFSIGYLVRRAGGFNLIVPGDENLLYNYSVK